MVRNRKLQKIRLQGDRSFHDTIVQELFKDPDCLNIRGLDKSSVVWKKPEYHYMHSKGHLDEGKYERFPGPDLVFVYYGNEAFRFLIVEVKGSILGRGHVDVYRQLDRARSYFTGFWKRIIVNEIKPHIIQRFGDLPSTDVLLSLAEVTREFGSRKYEVFPFGQDMYLGKLRVSVENGKVYFN